MLRKSRVSRGAPVVGMVEQCTSARVMTVGIRLSTRPEEKLRTTPALIVHLLRQSGHRSTKLMVLTHLSITNQCAFGVTGPTTAGVT